MLTCIPPSEMDHIIIAVDSRGRGLNDFIQGNLLFPYFFTILCIPGGKLDTLKAAITQTLHKEQRQNKTHIILAGGICNMTTKLKHEGGTELTYNQADKIDKLTTQLQNMSSHFNSFPNTSFAITTIPPASLKKANAFNREKQRLSKSIFTEQEIQQQQTELEHDIQIINKQISLINSNLGLRTVRWDRDILKTSIKKRGHTNKQTIKKVKKFNYKNLYDGVHACADLESKWYTILCRSIRADMVSVSHSDNSDDSDDQWDFKRHKVCMS